jgi:ATP-dependent Lon protease
VELTGTGESSGTSVAFLVTLFSLMKNQQIQPGLVVLGDMMIGGNIQPLSSLIEPLQLAMDNGAKRVLIPPANRRHFLEVPGDIIEKVDPIFYSDPVSAALKAIGAA